LSDFHSIQTQTGWGRVLEKFAAWCRPEPGWWTLDVGCGPGLLPALFAERGCVAFGADFDPAAFYPRPLHRSVVAADVRALSFSKGRFDLITASNLLFLLADPGGALRQIRDFLRPGGFLIALNPSERLTMSAAETLASQHGLRGVARRSLVNWARNAEANHRWSGADLTALFAGAGYELLEMALIMGPGFARLGRGVVGLGV